MDKFTKPRTRAAAAAASQNSYVQTDPASSSTRESQQSQTAASSSITDPSDWLTTQVPELKDVDRALRCYICKDFAKAPMMTACCSHTFCSLCIRRQFTADARCPMCLRAGSESQLRKNRELEMAIEGFLGVREKLFAMLAKPVRKEVEVVEQPTPTTNGTNSVVETESKDEKTQPAMVPCPICNEMFTVTEIETVHLARCLSGKALPPRTTQTQQSTEPRKKLPKPGTTNLKIKDLRTRLQKLGIPTQGSHTEMVRREAEWINIWNANCDMIKPRGNRELLQDLRQWEATIHQQESKNSTAAGVKKTKSFEDAREYSRAQNETFKALAKRARAVTKSKKRKIEQTESEQSSNEEIQEILPLQPPLPSSSSQYKEDDIEILDKTSSTEIEQITAGKRQKIDST